MTDEEHQGFHEGFRGFCVRCDVQKNPTLYASLASQAGGPWLTSGRSTSGQWGLGCKDCAAWLASGRRCKDARFSKFANFEVRPKSRFTAKFLVQQHHERRAHRVASGTERARRPKRAAKPPQPQPLACPIARLAEGPQLGGLSAEDAALFKGNVPSMAEWREGWAVLSETLSLRKAGRLRAKEHPETHTEAKKKSGSGIANSSA
jgi:hypothetical protein